MQQKGAALIICPGDVILYRPKRNDLIGDLISHITIGQFCHCSIVESVNSLSITVIESNNTASESGVQRTTIKFDPSQHSVYRAWAITNQQIERMLIFCKSKIGRPYDLIAFPGTFIRNVAAFLHLYPISTSRDPFNSDDAFYCSELIACAYVYATNMQPVRGLLAQSVTPNDLACSGSIFREVPNV